MDLGELWRERRWHHLWAVLVRLPRNSLTKEALANDEEFVAFVLEQEDDDEDDEMAKSIRQAEFSPEVEATYHVVDRLGEVVSGLVGLGGGRPRRVTPMRRPKTAFDRVAHEKRRDKHLSLTRRLLSDQDLAERGLTREQ